MQAKILIALGLAAALLLGIGGAYSKGRTDGAAIARATVAKNNQAALEQAIAQRDIQTKRASALVAAVTDIGTQLGQIEANLQKDAYEKILNIPTVTSGRPCLSASAVRLLNARSGGASTTSPARANPAPAGLASTATGQTASAVAASIGQAASSQPTNPPDQPVPNDPAATDTDVANWIADAQKRYAQCAARVTGWQLFWSKKVCE